MQRDYKLRSYTLNAVCAHFLGRLRSLLLGQTYQGADLNPFWQVNKRKTYIIQLLQIYKMVLQNLEDVWQSIVLKMLTYLRELWTNLCASLIISKWQE